MTKKKALTAEELMAQLRADPAYVAKIEAQVKVGAAAEAAEREVMVALGDLGYDAPSLGALLEKFAPLPSDLAGALAQMLGSVANTNVQEAIVRALGATRAEIDFGPLAATFDTTDSPTLRWAIANTLAEARPSALSSWLLERVGQPGLGKAREMLLLGVARASPPELANPVLVGLLGELPGHAALALAESGGSHELPHLRQAHRDARGWERDQLGRAIAIIERRGLKRV